MTENLLAILSVSVSNNSSFINVICWLWAGNGHPRISEMIFGGVSREILRQTAVPTLLSH